MDKIRVFVISTCYDLNQIRRDLEEFITSMGYQPVLSDSSDVSIPPGLDKIEVCKWLVRSSDIFVLIIGGRYGATDQESGKSITYEKAIPIYTFVDSDVWSRRPTYNQLKEMVRDGELSEEKLKSAIGEKIEDIRVFEFLDRIECNERDQWIYNFTQAKEIINTLKNNWSLLFKELLSQRRDSDIAVPATRLAPSLIIGWIDSQKGVVDEIFAPPPLSLTKEELIKRLESFRINKETLKLISEREKDIAELISTREPSELGLSKKPDDIMKYIRSVVSFATHIEDLIKLVHSDFKGVRLNY